MGGRLEGGERGGGAGLRAEKVAPRGLPSTAVVAAGLQRLACSLKSFVFKSKEEKLLLSLRQEDRSKIKTNHEKSNAPLSIRWSSRPAL